MGGLRRFVLTNLIIRRVLQTALGRVQGVLVDGHAVNGLEDAGEGRELTTVNQRRATYGTYSISPLSGQVGPFVHIAPHTA